MVAEGGKDLEGAWKGGVSEQVGLRLGGCSERREKGKRCGRGGIGVERCERNGERRREREIGERKEGSSEVG